MPNAHAPNLPHAPLFVHAKGRRRALSQSTDGPPFSVSHYWAPATRTHTNVSLMAHPLLAGVGQEGTTAYIDWLYGVAQVMVPRHSFELQLLPKLRQLSRRALALPEEYKPAVRQPPCCV